MSFYHKILIISVLFLYSCEEFFYGEEDLCGIPGGDNSICSDECGIPNGNGVSDGECDCDGNVEYIYCIDNDGDGNGLPGTEQEFCGDPGLEWSLECTDDLDSCDGVLDDCGICNGQNDCIGCSDPYADNWGGEIITIDDGGCYISYELSIQPIFDNHCVFCHGSSGGLDLSSYQSLMIGGDNGVAVIPNNSIESILIEKIKPNPSFGEQMGNLNTATINKISAWIDLGAIE